MSGVVLLELMKVGPGLGNRRLGRVVSPLQPGSLPAPRPRKDFGSGALRLRFGQRAGNPLPGGQPGFDAGEPRVTAGLLCNLGLPGLRRLQGPGCFRERLLGALEPAFGSLLQVGEVAEPLPPEAGAAAPSRFEPSPDGPAGSPPPTVGRPARPSAPSGLVPDLGQELLGNHQVGFQLLQPHLRLVGE